MGTLTDPGRSVTVFGIMHNQKVHCQDATPSGGTLPSHRELHVAKSGSDANVGSLEKPFQTLSAAARIARPGDTVTVHAGTYRESVNPRVGGDGNARRITYQAAPGERVVIKGSERMGQWEPSNGVWKTTIPNAFFGKYNPYKTRIAGDWYIDNGRDHHTGEVYLNGTSLFEVPTLSMVTDPQPLPGAMEPAASRYTWFCESDDAHTVIWANFHGADPRRENVEINVRETCFYPEQTGIDYITVRGFRMCHAATQWAPPTAEQNGLIGPHWAKGWIIENNIIHDAKCSGISLGKEASTGHNLWTRLWTKHGTQRERDVVFDALRIGWSKKHIGSHIVRGNTIYNCEQTGICGHLGAVFSEIHDNHIYNIYRKRQFSGFEIAGIKLHAPIDVTIRDNRIHHCLRGLWMDWQAQGTRISANLLYANDAEDVFVEVSHGPYIIDHNIMLSQTAFKNRSQGGAIVHNLIGGCINLAQVLHRYTHYHYPHATTVAGMMTIMNGDDRYYNNIFVKPPSPGDGSEAAESNEAFAGDLNPKHKAGPTPAMGLSLYDSFPVEGDAWHPTTHTGPIRYNEQRLPVRIAANLFLNGATPCVKGKGAVKNDDFDPQIELETTDDNVFLHLTANADFENVHCEWVDSDMLGEAFQAETRFEQPDGSDIVMDQDYLGNPRAVAPRVGPFERLARGRQRIQVWPKPHVTTRFD